MLRGDDALLGCRDRVNEIVTERDERRTPEQLRDHYEVERELSDRLRRAPSKERRSLYGSVYDELFRRVPDHPQLTWKADADERSRSVHQQLRLLGRYLGPDSSFLEVGAGDCALACEVARSARRVYAVDVSAEITRDLLAPVNLELILSDGCSIPVPPGGVDVAYSNQLMEHLHPEDAREQLRNIYAALAPGGAYVCITPNRLLGPADISMYFDDVATGFHLKEYTNAELATLCRAAGFRRVQSIVWLKWFGLPLPSFVSAALEAMLERLPTRVVKKAGRTPLSRLLGINMVAWKPTA